MSDRVWNGEVVGTFTGTGNGAWVTIPYQEVEAAPFCSVSGGHVTFSEAGIYYVAASIHCFCGNSGPDYMDMKIYAGTSHISARSGAEGGAGWAFGCWVSGIFEREIGETIFVHTMIAGNGADNLVLANGDESYGQHLNIARLS